MWPPITCRAWSSGSSSSRQTRQSFSGDGCISDALRGAPAASQPRPVWTSMPSEREPPSQRALGYERLPSATRWLHVGACRSPGRRGRSGSRGVQARRDRSRGEPAAQWRHRRVVRSIGGSGRAMASERWLRRRSRRSLAVRPSPLASPPAARIPSGECCRKPDHAVGRPTRSSVSSLAGALGGGLTGASIVQSGSCEPL